MDNHLLKISFLIISMSVYARQEPALLSEKLDTLIEKKIDAYLKNTQGGWLSTIGSLCGKKLLVGAQIITLGFLGVIFVTKYFKLTTPTDLQRKKNEYKLKKKQEVQNVKKQIEKNKCETLQNIVDLYLQVNKLNKDILRYHTNYQKTVVIFNEQLNDVGTQHLAHIEQMKKLLGTLNKTGQELNAQEEMLNNMIKSIQGYSKTNNYPLALSHDGAVFDLD